MKVSKAKALLADPKKVAVITFTSAQHIYPDRVENLKVVDADETIEFDYHKMHYVFDCTDCNCIIMNPDELDYNGLSIL